MEIRPLTKVIYELELITAEGEISESFEISYDSELYDNDRDSTDHMFLSFKMDELKDKYGSDVLLLEFGIERVNQMLH